MGYAPRIRPKPPVRYSPPADPVTALVRAGLCTETTARQWLKVHAPESPVVKAARIIQTLYETGHAGKADELLLELHLLRDHAPADGTPESFMRALEAAVAADAEQTVAATWAVLGKAEYQTWRKRRVRASVAGRQAIREGDALFGWWVA